MTVYVWSCPCGTEGRGEKAAQHHTEAGCELLGYPHGWDASRVFVAGHWTEAS